jgi:hypothetical protein
VAYSQMVDKRRKLLEQWDDYALSETREKRKLRLVATE